MSVNSSSLHIPNPTTAPPSSPLCQASTSNAKSEMSSLQLQSALAVLSLSPGDSPTDLTQGRSISPLSHAHKASHPVGHTQRGDFTHQADLVSDEDDSPFPSVPQNPRDIHAGSLELELDGEDGWVFSDGDKDEPSEPTSALNSKPSPTITALATYPIPPFIVESPVTVECSSESSSPRRPSCEANGGEPAPQHQGEQVADSTAQQTIAGRKCSILAVDFFEPPQSNQEEK